MSEGEEVDAEQPQEEQQNEEDEQQVEQDQDNAEESQMLQDPNVFMTQQKLEQHQVWKSFDFLFPGGRLGKLVKLNYMNAKTFPFMEILTKLKLDDGYPVVNFIGARVDPDNPDNNRGKFYAGIARACHNTDAIIVDNGISSGIEKYAMRRNCHLIGVAPEVAITYPKLNPTKIDRHELSNGHSHLFLISDDDKNMKFGSEALFKLNLCKILATGKISKTQGRPRCKIVNILFADTIDCFDEIREAIINKLPIIVVRGSDLCDQFIRSQIEEVQYRDKEFEDIMTDKDAHFYPIDSLNSEVVAQLVHYLLTYTPYLKLNKQI